MGGGVVAPLTAWNDKTVRDRFGGSMVLGFITQEEEEEDFIATEQMYEKQRRMLVRCLNNEFIHSLAVDYHSLAVDYEDPHRMRVRREEVDQAPGIVTYMTDHCPSITPLRTHPVL